MPEFFVLLLMQVTIFSSVTALILIAVKQIFKCRIHPFIGAVLWVILLARLLCPIYPESKISIYNFIPVGRNIMFSLTNDIGDELDEKKEELLTENNPYVVKRDTDLVQDLEEIPQKNRRDALTVGEYFTDFVSESNSTADKRTRADQINLAILVLYLSGIAAALTGSLLVYIRAKKRALRTSEPCENRAMLALYEETAEQLGFAKGKHPLLRCGESPMVIGCRSPQIVCRDDLDPREMRMVFAHELIHCKYLDNPILLFSTCVACLFWFNPLIWVVRNILREDLEVLCDERSLTYCQIPHTEYALMLCRSCAYSELVLGAGCHMSASGRRLKNRLRTISTGKNRKFLPKAASVLLCAAIVMVCLTNPIVSQNSDYSAYIENYAELTGGDERAMHLSQQETVSSYLSQMAAVLKDWYGENCAHSIGNGSLERFKRLCAAWNIPKEILTNIQMLRTDEPLTVKNCALLNACMTVMLESEIADGTETVLLPRVITEQDLQSVLDHLTETEANALLKCYNRGVAGADVSFDAFYSEAMMELICSRINDSWAENKFTGFYHVLNLKGKDLSSFNTAFRDLFAALRMDSVYVCDPTITSVEKEKLAQILGCAYAGQQEDVYYLKKTEDGCSFEIAERLMKRGGFTPEQMLVGYAKIGEAPEFDIYRGCRLAVVRTDEPVIIGAVRTEIADAVRYMYSLGLIDAENGTIDLTQRLSCGQGIAYVYRMAAAIIPIT